MRYSCNYTAVLSNKWQGQCLDLDGYKQILHAADLPLATAATAVGGGHGGAAGLAVPRDQTVLRGAV